MKTLNLAQGSESWHAHRVASRNASDAPALMGASAYTSRAELIKRLALGIEPEHDDATLKRFARGHEVEPLLRAYADRVSGLEFYPVVGTSDDGYLSASFDGVTMDESAIFEAKQTNQSKMESVRGGILPAEDWWQIVQQFAVCDAAERCFYCVGDGSDAGTVHLVVARAAVAGDIPTLRAAWAQLEADIAVYVPEPTKATAVAEVVTDLPAVSVQVSGALALASNLDAFEVALRDFIDARLIREPQTDNDFATLDLQIKALKKAEAALDQAEASALAQITSVEQMQRQKAALHKLTRDNRLMAEKLLEARKSEIRAQVAAAASADYTQHLAQMNATLAVPVIAASAFAGDVAAAIKGKRSIDSLRADVAQVVANHKIAASAQGDRHRANLAVLEACGRPELFGDRDNLVRSKQPEDLQNLAKARIADADAQAQARLEAERERIRAEEQQKARDEQARLFEQQREADKGADGLPWDAPRIYADEPPPRLASNDPPPKAPETPAAVAVSDEATQPPVAAVRPGAVVKLLKLGDINERIWPLTVTADGLATLGFQPHTVERAAKLYREDQFPEICRAIERVVVNAMNGIDQRRAA